ncbi:hypothetical protein [Nocardia sp. NBC_01009]|uniref:hypothetical protein n=1 Tax=Nocardia sp. NBC_01009 TaxID=2975996 RepID=UPI0038652F8D|nr:hypothetical protein OHA42_32375 [Nocardia sp. NBC_01009]
MAQSLNVDLGALRASASDLDQLADEASRFVTELKTTIAHEGAPWGQDSAGKSFEETYLPDSERAVRSLELLVANLRAVGAGVADAADAFEGADLDGAARIRRSGPIGGNGANLDVPTPTIDGPAPAVDGPAVAEPAEPFPGNTLGGRPPASVQHHDDAARAADPAVGRYVDTVQAASLPETGSEQSAARQPGPQSDSAGRSQDVDPAVGGPPDPIQTSGTPVAPPISGATPVGSNPTSLPAGQGPMTTDRADNSRVGSPWSRGTSRAPVPRPTDTPPAPVSSVRPKVSAPQTPGPQPGAARPASSPRPKTPQRRTGSAELRMPSDTLTDAETMRIAREMADRHSLQLAGFETAGVGEHAVREIAAALDDMLATYPVPFAGIELADRHDGTLSGVVSRDRGSDEVRWPSSSVWIVIERAAAANPALLATAVRAETRSGDRSPGSEDRPMYSTVVHEFGRVLVIAAGLRTLRAAQRALIAEYLTVSGTRRGDHLGRVVADYKQWRRQLSGRRLSQGSFDPAVALADAFATVELGAEKAQGPAQVLHRLLAEVAQGSAGAR